MLVLEFLFLWLSKPDSTRIFEFYVDVRRPSYPNVIGIWDMELEAPRRRE